MLNDSRSPLGSRLAIGLAAGGLAFSLVLFTGADPPPDRFPPPPAREILTALLAASSAFLLGMGTRRPRPEPELRDLKLEPESTERLRALLELALSAGQAGVWSLDPHTNRVRMDERVDQLLRTSGASQEWRLDEWIQGLEPGDREQAVSSIRASVDLDEPFRCVLRRRGRDGRLRHLQYFGWLVRDIERPFGRLVAYGLTGVAPLATG